MAARKSIFRRVTNRLCNLLARVSPGSTTLRVWLQRLRGVKIGQDVFLGDGVFVDGEYPECIEIQDRVQISIRAILIAHTRGPGRLIIEQEAFIGPNAVLACGAGRTLRVGAGAVIGAGCVITKSVPPRLYMASPPAQPMGRVGVPLPVAKTMEEFWSGLTPLDAPAKPAPPPDKT